VSRIAALEEKERALAEALSAERETSTKLSETLKAHGDLIPKDVFDAVELRLAEETAKNAELEKGHALEIDKLSAELSSSVSRIAALEEKERALAEALSAERETSTKLSETLKAHEDFELANPRVPKDVFDAVELRLVEETAKNAELEKGHALEIDKLSAELSSSVSRIAALEEKEHTLSMDLELERSALAKAGDSLIEAEKRFADERNLLLETMVPNTVLVAAQVKFAEDRERHCEEVESLERKIAEASLLESSLRSDLDTERLNSLNLSSENSRLKSEIDGMVPKADLALATGKLQEAEQQVRTLEARLVETEDSLKAQGTALNEEICKLRLEVESGITEKEGLQTDLKQLKEKHEADMILMNQNMVSRSLLEAAELRLTEDLGQIEALRSRLTETEQVLASTQNDLKKTTVELESFHAQVDEIVIENEHLYSEYERLLKLTKKPAVNPLEKTVAALYAKISELEANLEASEKERTSLASEMSRHNSGVSAIVMASRKQSEIANAVKDPALLRNELNAAQLKIESLEKKVESLQNARRQLDPWGFSKEAELGHSRFHELQRMLSGGLEISADSEHGSNNRTHKDSLGSEMFSGAVPARFFSGMRSKTAEGPREKTTKQPSSPYATTMMVQHFDFPRLCVHCGRDPDDIRSAAPSKESPNPDPLKESESSRPNSPAKESSMGYTKMPSIQKKLASFQHENKNAPPGKLSNRAQTAQSIFTRPQPQSVLHHALGVEPFGILTGELPKPRKNSPDSQEGQPLFVKRPFAPLPAVSHSSSPSKEEFAKTR
jgi:multidrug resistance efflux pump